MSKPQLLRLRDLHEAVCSAMEVCDGDTPVVVDGGCVPMPITQIESCGLKLFNNGRLEGARVVRDPEGECDCGAFVISFPSMLSSGFWRRAIEPDCRQCFGSGVVPDLSQLVDGEPLPKPCPACQPAAK